MGRPAGAAAPRVSPSGRASRCNRWPWCCVARRDEQEEAHHDLVLLEHLAVDLGMHEYAREVVGGVLPPLGDQRAAALEDLRDVVLDHALEALGVEIRIAGAE